MFKNSTVTDVWTEFYFYSDRLPPEEKEISSRQGSVIEKEICALLKFIMVSQFSSWSLSKI